MSSAATASAPPPPPLRDVLEKASHGDDGDGYHELVMRLLFCTVIVAGDSQYRIREIEMYHVDDPYTHQGDEQVSSTGGWYFHRTKPGGGWKGGTFMGLDISFAPIGTAGGVLIRGISRIPQDNDDEGNVDTYQYIDGSCNCVKELLKACGVSKIKELVDKPNFKWDALAQDNNIFRLMELEEPIGVAGDPTKKLNPTAQMEWKASSRIGLSEPNKFGPEKAKARKKYHLAPLRFLQAPYETKKEKTKLKNSTLGGVFTKQEYDKINQQHSNSNGKSKSKSKRKAKNNSGEEGDDAKKPPPAKKAKLNDEELGSDDDSDTMPIEKLKKKEEEKEAAVEESANNKKKKKPKKFKIELHWLFNDNDNENKNDKGKDKANSKGAPASTQKDGSSKTKAVAKNNNNAIKKTFIDSDSDDDEMEWEESNEEQETKNKKDITKNNKKDKNMVKHKGKPVWHYWLDIGMDGMAGGRWHSYEKSACAKLEGFLKSKGQQISRTTWHLKSGHFSYAVDISKMTQTNMSSGTVRPIRRVLPGEVCSMSEPPVYIPPKKAESDDDDDDTAELIKHAKKLSKEEKEAAKKEKKADDDDDDDDNDLKLGPLFVGKYGHSWDKVLTDVIEAQPNAGDFIGPNRSKQILPIREMTFRALMAVAPEENNLIVFGQGPYPRVESASGIAMFDTLIKDWDSPQFGKTVSMRCIAKTAAVAKGIVGQDANVKTLRKVFKEKEIVSPPEWFQCMLAQGVLLLNASLTIGSDISTAKHTNFWKPVMRAIVQEILRAKKEKFPADSPKRRVGFLWWGNEALKTKKFLAPLLAAFSNDVEITHIEHYNPAAQGDKFSQPPNHFDAVNEALVNGNLEPIDWLPTKEWLKAHHLDEHAAFITDTQELHQMYLDRLQAGLDLTDLKPILGIMEMELLSLPDACDSLGLKTTAASALSTVQKFEEKALDDNEKGAIYLYTTNVLYRRLNEALRNANRSRVKVYFNYLRVFLQAYTKMKSEPKMLYRGINKDLSKQYAKGAQVVWWNVSSCTPNLFVAKNFGGGSSSGTLFYVKAKTAVPIMHLSAYQSEEEWVLAPGTVLKVESVVKKAGQATEIHLEEVEGKRWVK